MSETETPQAKIFRRMAARLDHNADAVFAGAAVIVPPAEGGEAVEMLILDIAQSPAQFWGSVKTKCELELGKLDEKSRNTQAFGRR
jgi:hypothetical protein